MDRHPVVAGQFYTADPGALEREVRGYLDEAEAKSGGPTLLAMAPHAGYVFSGSVAGRTLGAAELAPSILLLGPSHTGRGRSLAVWPEGRWFAPGGGVDVDAELAGALLAADPRLAADEQAHGTEHSLEVLVPFLMQAAPGARVVPMCVSEPGYAVLAEVAANLAGAVEALARPVSVVVSSDMSHYVSRERARELDSLALDAVLALDPEALYRVVRSRGITMCGVLPMVLGLLLAKAMGASKARLAAYATSGDVTGDNSHVVGYAGVLVS
ncbi:AmmeMemoRadiSam system protein B [Desulfocurvus sp. DL9XJH121]